MRCHECIEASRRVVLEVDRGAIGARDEIEVAVEVVAEGRPR
jgi:hypothetical protein